MLFKRKAAKQPKADNAMHTAPAAAFEAEIREAQTQADTRDTPPIATYEMLGDVIVTTVTCAELYGEDADRLMNEMLQAALEQGAKHFVLDLQSVTYVDSSCLGALVQALHQIESHGGKIALAYADTNIEHVFRLTRLDRAFPLCRDVLAAIQTVQRIERNTA